MCTSEHAPLLVVTNSIALMNIQNLQSSFIAKDGLIRIEIINELKIYTKLFLEHEGNFKQLKYLFKNDYKPPSKKIKTIRKLFYLKI